MNQNKEPKLVSRRCVGVSTFAGGSGLPIAYLLYEERYLDGSVNLVKGHSVSSYPTSPLVNEKFFTKEEVAYAQAAYKPNLDVIIDAATLLNNKIIEACKSLDKACGLEEE